MGLLTGPALASGPARPAGAELTAIPGSLTATRDASIGAYTSRSMSVEVVLAPRNAAALQKLLESVYTPGSASYHHWLAKGAYAANFAPSAAESSTVARYLAGNGLDVGRSSSPFLVSASGTSAHVAAAFHTSLRTYRDARGLTYFSNSSAVALPSSIAGGVLGVVGLSNTVRLHDNIVRAGTSKSPAKATSCETPYVTRAQLYAYVNNGTGFPYGFGAGPGCSGLSPSQTNSIYRAPVAGKRAQGSNATLAVFE